MLTTGRYGGEIRSCLRLPWGTVSQQWDLLLNQSDGELSNGKGDWNQAEPLEDIRSQGDRSPPLIAVRRSSKTA